MKLVRRHFRLPGKAMVALLLAMLVLMLDAMASCPSLHELIHKDADKADHACAITMFAHGQVDSTSGHVAVVVPVALIETTAPVIFSVPSTTIQNLPPGRAPPIFSVVS